jgi:hypothetical protein
MITDLVVALALGGDCLANVAMVRAQPELFGPTTSDPVISRLVTGPAADAPGAEPIRSAQQLPGPGPRSWLGGGPTNPRSGPTPVRR